MKRHLKLLRLDSATALLGALIFAASPAVTSVAQTRLDIQPIDDQFTNEGDLLVVPITAQNVNASTFGGFVFDGLPSFVTAVDNGDGTASITINPLVGHGGIYQIVVSASDIELQQFDSEVFAVAVAFTGNVGFSSTVPVSLAFPSVPSTSELFFRPSGASAFQGTPLTQIADTLFEGTIPNGPETSRGVEYYVQFFDGEVFTTLPTVAPTTRPARLRYRFNLLEGIALERETYRMISVPAVLDNPDPILTLADDLEAPNPRSWRVLRWATAEEVYDELPLLDAQFDPGVGFWMISATDAAISVGPGLSTDVETAQQLVLEAGWNQIGSPFAFPVAWSDIDPNRIVESPVAYNGIEYIYDQSVVSPWDGYFVYNPQGSTVLLPVPPVEAGSRGQKAARTPTALYSIRLSVSTADGKFRDTQNFVGFSEDAADGLDWTDLSEAPAVGNHIRFSIMEGHRRLARSYVDPHDEGAHWDFELRLSLPHEALPIQKTAIVRMSEAGSRPIDFETVLVERSSGQRLEIDADRHVALKLTPNETQHFRLVAGSSEYVETTASSEATAQGLRIGPAYPNPFSTRVVIPFGVIEAGHIRVDVFDVIGRQVRSLINEDRFEGTHTVLWDGMDGAGRPVASGLYFCRIAAGQSRAQTAIMVSR